MAINEEGVKKIHEKLSDREWRLNNLYYIKDKKGKKVLFKPNVAQRELLDNLWYMNIVPKARQLGITTFFTILYLDAVLFSENKTAGIIAHRQEDMRKIFRNKIVFAWENMPDWVRMSIGEPIIQTANEIVWNKGQSIFVSMTTRSQTPNFLHISEYGYICSHDPAKADEILTGAINSVDAGQMISIESTAEGREGHFYRLTMLAKKLKDEGRKLTRLDFKLFFFPWFLDEGYRVKEDERDLVKLNQNDEAYFKNLEQQHDIKLDDLQQKWYVKKKETNGEGMYREFPSTIDEAFAVSLEGAYYKSQMDRVYLENRIGFFPVDPAFEVDTAWDLGMNDQTVILFFQTIGPEIRFVDEYANSGQGLKHYVDVLQEKKYRYGKHHLPHDAAVRDISTGFSRETMLWDLGLSNTYISPRLTVLEGIDKVRLLFPRFRFNESTTPLITGALASYRKEWDANNGVWKNSARHDDSSHFADALRSMAVVWNEGQAQYGGEGEAQIISVFG